MLDDHYTLAEVLDIPHNLDRHSVPGGPERWVRIAKEKGEMTKKRKKLRGTVERLLSPEVLASLKRRKSLS